MKKRNEIKISLLGAMLGLAIMLGCVFGINMKAHAEEYTALSLNETKRIEIESDSIIMSYTPSTSGKYVLESFGGHDPYVRVFTNGEMITSDADSGFNNNFRVLVDMTAGSEYLFEIGGSELQCDVILTKYIAASSINISNADDTLTLSLFYYYPLSVDMIPTSSNTLVEYTSANKEVVTVSDNVLYAQGFGTTTITATTDDGITDTITVKVVEPPLINEGETMFFLQGGAQHYDTVTFVPSKSTEYEIIINNNTNTYKSLRVYDSLLSQVGYYSSVSSLDYGYSINLTAGNKYYIKLGFERNLPSSFDMTIRKKTDSEQTVSGVGFKKDSMTVGLGDVFIPEHIIYPEGVEESVTYSSSNADVLEVKSDGIYAQSVGSADITVTTSNGYTDTISITVKDAKELTLDKLQSVSISTDYSLRGFCFTAPEAGTYTIQSMSYSYNPTCSVYDIGMNSVSTSSESLSKGFYRSMSMEKGEKYYFRVGEFRDEGEFEIVVSKPSTVSSVELVLKNGHYLYKSGDTYYFNMNSIANFYVMTTTPGALLSGTYSIVIEDESVAEMDKYNDIIHISGPGETNITVEADGVTHTIKVIAGELASGDTNYDGKVDTTDLIKVIQLANGDIELENRIKAMADYNGDNKVDELDIELLGKVIGVDPDTIEITEVSFDVKHNLNLLDLVQIGYWFTATPNNDVEIVDYGILIWDEEAYLKETNFTILSENAYQPELTERNGFQMGYGEGVYAQYLDTKYYAIPYVVTSKGEYIYSKTPDVYSVPTYATEQAFKNSTNTELKMVVYDLLNYATYAQYYFYERNTDIDVSSLTPINSVLSEDKQVNRYMSSMLVSSHTISKDTSKNMNCSWLYTTANLEESIGLNFFAEQSDDFAGMLYWTADGYAAASSLVFGTQSQTIPVADRTVYGSDTTTGQIPSIYPKDLADPQYACMYYEYRGVYYYGEVKVDSVAAYLTRAINATDETANDSNYYFENMCKAMLAYGDSAKAYAEM